MAFLKRFTGKELLEKLNDYGQTSEVVLLGLKQDLDNLDARVKHCEQTVAAFSKQVENLLGLKQDLDNLDARVTHCEQTVAAFSKQVEQLRRFSLFAYLTALALGGALAWLVR